MNNPAPLSQRQYDYMLRCFNSWFNVAEGGKRGGKNVLQTIIFCTLLETHKNRIFLVGGVSSATARLNILDCDGYGLLNYFEGRCREGKYQNRECVYVNTKSGQKIVLISGGGKDGDEKLIKGNTYGMAYVTEANECQKKFDDLEAYRKGNTHRKNVDGIEIIDESTYNKLIKNVKRNGGVIIRGTSEVEEHLAKNGSTAACIGDVILFSKKATISDVLEETYHFEQNVKKMNHNKPARERLLLNEIDAQKYLLSVSDKYHIPESELEVTRKNLADYEKALEEYYENRK